MKNTWQRYIAKSFSRCSCTCGMNPKTFADSLILNRDTPSAVAKQSFDRKSKVYSLPKYLHTICRQAMPHCMESCWWMNGKSLFIFNLISVCYKRLLCLNPAPVPLYFSLFALKTYRKVNPIELDENDLIYVLLCLPEYIIRR